MRYEKRIENIPILSVELGPQSFLVSSGVRVCTYPRRFDIRCTWMSTQMPGPPKARLTTRLADFLPTPLKVKFMVSGTFSRICQRDPGKSTGCWQLLPDRKPTGYISPANSVSVRPNISLGVAARENSRSTAAAETGSVVRALRTAAIRILNGRCPPRPFLRPEEVIACAEVFF